MKIKEKRYIKKCDCGTEIIYTRRDCYHNTTWDIYSLYCPSCSHEYSYRRGTHHDLFDKEYEEDSVDKDEEIERLNNKINELEKENNKIKMALDYIQNAKGKDINYVATLLSGYPTEISEMREQFLESIGSDK